MKKFFLRYWHYLLIIFPLLIFIYSIWDHNFYIGGDVLIPLNPLNNIQKIFLWDNSIGIESFQYAGFLWFAFYYLFSLIGIPAFITQKILLVLLLVIGFIFTYLSYKELFRDTKYSDAKLAFLAAVIFTFNPIYFLLTNAYLPLYGFPVCFYFLIKFLQKGKILYAILFLVLLNFFFFIDLPQPKLLIVFGIACLFIALLYRQMRTISFKDISIRLIIIFSLSILLNSWVLIPLFHGVFFGGGFSPGELITYGGRADFKTATMLYIARFFNYNIIKYYPQLEHFLTSPVFIIWTFTQWILLILATFLAAKDRKGQKIIYTMLVTILFFIFIAKGSNPPLGQLYRYVIIHFPLARIFRTTSSVITGAVVFYAFLFSISIYYLSSLLRKKKAIVYTIIVLHIAIFYPIYFGYKFYNPISNAPNQKGYAIPAQYYEMGKQLDSIKEDSKVLSLPLVRGYVSKNWSYFGPDILSWITKKPLIYRRDGYALSADNKKNLQIAPNDYKTYSLNNVRYLLFQKDSILGDSYGYYGYKDLSFGDLLLRNGYFDLYKIDDKYFLPHIYPTTTPTIVSGDIEVLAPMTEIKYLDGKPVLVFVEQMQKGDIRGMGNWGLETGILGDWGRSVNFVFKDVSWQDLAVELAAQSTVDSPRSTVKIETPGVYEICLDVSEIEEEIPEFDIKIDGKEIVLRDWAIMRLGSGDWETEKLGRKYVKVGEAEMGEGRHKIEVHSSWLIGDRENKNLKIVLVNKKERQELEKEIWEKMNRSETEVCYIFEKDRGDFWVN